MAVAVLTTLVIVVVAYLSFPVTGIRVEGARMYPESDAWDAVSQHASLLTLNEDRLERKIQSNPWVKGAEVSSNSESGIVMVEVEERRPVLDAMVGDERRTLASDGTELPGLGGADLRRVELGEDQVGEVLKFGKVVGESGLVVDSVDAAGPGGIEATVEGRRVIFSGGTTEEQARALEGVMGRHPEAPVLDLRSPDRIVVAEPSDPGADSGSRG